MPDDNATNMQSVYTSLWHWLDPQRAWVYAIQNSFRRWLGLYRCNIQTPSLYSILSSPIVKLKPFFFLSLAANWFA